MKFDIKNGFWLISIPKMFMCIHIVAGHGALESIVLLFFNM